MLPGTAGPCVSQILQNAASFVEGACRPLARLDDQACV